MTLGLTVLSNVPSEIHSLSFHTSQPQGLDYDYLTIAYSVLTIAIAHSVLNMAVWLQHTDHIYLITALSQMLSYNHMTSA